MGGKVLVLLPPKVDATVNAQVGVGEIDVFGHHTGGPGTDVELTDNGADGPGGGHVHVTITSGAGTVEVTREAA